MFKSSEGVWSPYVAGIIIGLLAIPALAISDTILDPALGWLSIGQGLVALNDASSHIWGSREDWQVALVTGLSLGGMLPTVIGEQRPSLSRPTSPMYHRQIFIGAFLMIIGAGIVNGGPSGHAIVGIAQLSLSSVIILVAMIAGGLATGFWFRRG